MEADPQEEAQESAGSSSKAGARIRKARAKCHKGKQEWKEQAWQGKASSAETVH